MPTAELIVTLTRWPEPEELRALPAGVRWLEVRADLLGDRAPDELARLRAATGAGLLYTLRSRAEGGQGDDDPGARAERLIAAAGHYERLDLEGDRDGGDDVLAAIPAERRIVSWHGPALAVEELGARLRRLRRMPAGLYKLVPAAGKPGEERAPLELLHAERAKDVTAFASGPSGTWTRPLAPRLGAPVVYGALPGATPGAPGQLSIDRLVADFGLPELPPLEAVFGVVGNPVASSLSPRLHNRAYRALGLPFLFLPFHTEHFGDFWLELIESEALAALGWPLRGLAVTAPYKDVALAVSGAASPRAGAIGAANTLIWNQGVWEAESTDPEGVLEPLRRRGVGLEGARVAVVGSGGAGRSAVVGLEAAGAQVSLVNRDEERGRHAAHELRVPFMPLASFDPGPFAVVVQATSLGRGPADPLPFDPAGLAAGAVVVDLVYGEEPTPLLRAAAARGVATIDGREVLLEQAAEQFRRMTGQLLPRAEARMALGLAAESSGN